MFQKIKFFQFFLVLDRSFTYLLLLNHFGTISCVPSYSFYLFRSFLASPSSVFHHIWSLSSFICVPHILEFHLSYFMTHILSFCLISWLFGTWRNSWERRSVNEAGFLPSLQDENDTSLWVVWVSKTIRQKFQIDSANEEGVCGW